MGWNGSSRLKERIGYLTSPGGVVTGLWWLARRAARLEYDWVVECLLDPARPYQVTAEPFRLRKAVRPDDVATIPPALLEELEQHTWTSVANHVALGEAIYFLTDGDRAVCQMNVAGGPRARIDSPMRGWLELPPDAVYQSYAYTHERYRRHGAARKLFGLMHNDLANQGTRKVYGIVSRTNVPQIGNLSRLGFRPVASVWATRRGTLLYARGLARISIRYVPAARS